ncbi:MAG: arginase family protein [Promethearchaeota archaeon]
MKTFYDFGEIIDINTDFVIFGIPWDYLTSINSPNSAMAPNKIREISDNLSLTTEMGFNITNLQAVDIGNVIIEEKDIDRNLKKIMNFVQNIYEQKKEAILVMIGGDHFCTYPVIKIVGEHNNEKNKFGVLIFDTHLDFYSKFDKGIYSHATLSHRIFDLEFINDKNFLIVGTRDIDIPELNNAKKANISHFDAFLLSELGLKKFIKKVIYFFNQSNIENLYVSIDIDAIDPSNAPGTGFAVPGGLSYREIWLILKEISKNFNILGFDVVEIAPNLDLPNNMTSMLAAKLIVEFMSFIANK